MKAAVCPFCHQPCDPFQTSVKQIWLFSDEPALSVRAYNCLRENVITMGELLRLTPSQVLAWKGCGPGTLANIQAVLASFDLSLASAAAPAIITTGGDTNGRNQDLHREDDRDKGVARQETR